MPCNLIQNMQCNFSIFIIMNTYLKMNNFYVNQCSDSVIHGNKGNLWKIAYRPVIFKHRKYSYGVYTLPHQ